MSHRLPAFLLGFALAGQALAQAPSLNLRRLERPWPGGGTAVQAMTVGSFVPNHEGATAVVAINGSLWSSFQPALWQHFAASGGSGVQRLATVAAADPAGALPMAWNRTDHLAVIRGDGLRLLQFGPTSFVDATLTNISDPSWTGAIGLAAGIEGSGAVRARYVLGWSAGWVKLSVVDATLGLLPVGTFPAPPGIAVHDAALIDWNVGGPPEVAVLLANGTAVLDVNGLPQAWLPRIAGEGRLCAWRRGNLPALTVVSRAMAADDLSVHTHQPDGFHLDGGLFPLATGLTGLQVTTINDDEHPDLLVSHTGTSRLFVPGTASGPSVGGQVGLRAIYDVDPISLPSPVPSNLAPAVVTDINRDGLPDLVLASAATSELVLQLGLAPQMASALANNGNSQVDGVDASTGLTFDAGVGFDKTVYEGMLPMAVDTSSLDLVGLRLHLPAGWDSYQFARAVVYAIDSDGDIDDVEVNKSKVYSYPIASVGSSAQLLTIYVPVRQALTELGIGSAIELTLTKDDGTAATTPLLLANVHYPADEIWHTGDPVPLPGWSQFIWWYIHAQLLRMYGPPYNPPPSVGGSVLVDGNRQIGFLGVALDEVTAAELESLPAPVPVTGGATAH